MKKKIIIPAFALLIGTALAGSVSSTIAWYQYSTRTTAAYVGVTSGSSENLQMRFKKDNQGAEVGWTSRITYQQMEEYLDDVNIGYDMLPITSGALTKDAALPNKLYQNPIAGIKAQTSWKEATAANYVVIPLEFRYVKRDGQIENGADAEFTNKKVNLNEVHIAQRFGDENDHSDISKAIRVHFSAINDSADATDPDNFTNALISKNGETIDTHGPLDLDSEPGNDYTYELDKYGFKSQTKEYIDYGAGQQSAYKAPNQEAQTPIAPIEIGTTGAVAGKYLSVNVTIWVEGWQKLTQPAVGNQQAQESAIWDLEQFVASEYEIGFEFEAVDA